MGDASFFISHKIGVASMDKSYHESGWRLRIILRRALRRFSEDELEVLNYHAENMLGESLWVIICREPAKALKALGELFGSEESALNIIRQMLLSAVADIGGEDHHADALVRAIRENDVGLINKLVDEIFSLMVKGR